MKCNENKFSDVILLKLQPTVNVFLVRFQTTTQQTQGGRNNVILALFERRNVETKLN